jgi:uncharacterized protein
MFRSAILKLTAICNLNCSYCYVFNQADRTHERVPRHLDLAYARRFIERISEHLKAHDVKEFHLALHGGEPTIWPVASLKGLLEAVRQANNSELDIRTTIQTNAYAISDEVIRILADHNVHIGISLDGPKIFNDRYRVTLGRAGSYDRVLATAHRILECGYPGQLSGFLCVAPLELEPATFLEWVDRLPVRDVDVLWPIEYHHDNPPWKPGQLAAYAVSPPIGQWFSELFALWLRRDDPTLRVRLFEECIAWHLGASRHTDNIVNDRISSLVVNTDGGIEYHDYFRASRDGGSRTSFNVLEHTLDEVLLDEGFDFLQNLDRHCPPECRSCGHRAICGGGFLPGRFDANHRLPVLRSVLCFDEFAFFETVARLLTPISVRSNPSETGSIIQRLQTT